MSHAVEAMGIKLKSAKNNLIMHPKNIIELEGEEAGHIRENVSMEKVTEFKKHATKVFPLFEWYGGLNAPISVCRSNYTQMRDYI